MILVNGLESIDLCAKHSVMASSNKLFFTNKVINSSIEVNVATIKNVI